MDRTPTRHVAASSYDPDALTQLELLSSPLPNGPTPSTNAASSAPSTGPKVANNFRNALEQLFLAHTHELNEVSKEGEQHACTLQKENKSLSNQLRRVKQDFLEVSEIVRQQQQLLSHYKEQCARLRLVLKDKGMGEDLTEEEPEFVSVLEMKLSSTRELAEAPRTKTKAAAWLRRMSEPFKVEELEQRNSKPKKRPHSLLLSAKDLLESEREKQYLKNTINNCDEPEDDLQRPEAKKKKACSQTSPVVRSVNSATNMLNRMKEENSGWKSTNVSSILSGSLTQLTEKNSTMEVSIRDKDNYTDCEEERKEGEGEEGIQPRKDVIDVDAIPDSRVGFSEFYLEAETDSLQFITATRKQKEKQKENKITRGVYDDINTPQSKEKMKKETNQRKEEKQYENEEYSTVYIGGSSDEEREERGRDKKKREKKRKESEELIQFRKNLYENKAGPATGGEQDAALLRLPYSFKSSAAPSVFGIALRKSNEGKRDHGDNDDNGEVQGDSNYKKENAFAFVEVVRKKDLREQLPGHECEECGKSQKGGVKQVVEAKLVYNEVPGIEIGEDKERLEDVGFLTSMVLVLLGNYSQTGHFGGPLSYTPANVAMHLGGPANGGLSYDIRHPKHPFTDKFMLTGGHCIPTCYALWMILYEAMNKQFEATNDEKYRCPHDAAIYAIDALGFRRGPDAVTTLLKDSGLEEHELFKQAKIRGIRALMGHSETTDVTNDVNGGPSGVGVANTAGKALFWDFVGAPLNNAKIIAFEGEFAFTEGHAQELKTVALAQQVGKRLRLFFSYNNAGIDDSLVGGVIHEKYASQYDIANQFVSYGWNVFTVEDGASYEQLLSVFKKMEDWPEDDRRPMVVIAKTVKGWWPANLEKQVIGYPSHPYGFAMNSDYFKSLATSFENKYGVKFAINESAPKTEKDRLIEFKTNIDIALSVLDKTGLGKWVADRLLSIAGTLPNKLNLRFDQENNPFFDARLKVENLPLDDLKVNVTHPTTGKEVTASISLFSKPGLKKGTRRAISEVGKWINYVTGNRLLTISADLSHSINMEACSLTGHFDPVTNPQGTRLKAGIQECANAATICGLVSQTLSQNPDVHVGVWGITGTYGAFTPFFYLPVRIFSQQNQDSPFRLGVLTVIAGHSGPETAADARSHFGIFAPQVWTLFPEGQIVNLYLWDYNDVAPAYFAAAQLALSKKECGVIVIHVARPDIPVADRNTFADTDLMAAAKGAYLIRDYDDKNPQMGTVLVQGASSTYNLVKILPRLEAAGINVRVVAVISEELFRVQPKEYQEKVMPLSARLDCMVVTTMTKRIFPLSGLGPLTKEYTLSSDFDDRWRTGGLEPDVIAEAHLDEDHIFEAVKRFALDKQQRLERQRQALASLF